MSKPDPKKVNPGRAQAAYDAAKDRQSAYSEYIRLTFRQTGQLAPGCDAKDLIAFFDQNGMGEKPGQTKATGQKPRRRSRG